MLNKIQAEELALEAFGLDRKSNKTISQPIGLPGGWYVETNILEQIVVIDQRSLSSDEIKFLKNFKMQPKVTLNEKLKTSPILKYKKHFDHTKDPYFIFNGLTDICLSAMLYDVKIPKLSYDEAMEFFKLFYEPSSHKIVELHYIRSLKAESVKATQ